MPSAVRLREDFSAEALRALAKRVEGRQSEPAASVAGGGEGRDGPRRGGQDRRHGPPDAARLGSSLQRRGAGRVCSTIGRRPDAAPVGGAIGRVGAIVEAGPDRKKDGVVRWRRIDLKRVIAERFGVDFHPRYVGTLLKKLGFSHMSARPRHPAQDERIVEAFKKRMARPVRKGFCRDWRLISLLQRIRPRGACLRP